MKKIVYIILITTLTSFLFNCQKTTSVKETYYYETGSGCADGYPIETYRQAFYTQDNELITIDGLGSQRGPWGDGGVTYVKNENKQQRLPVKMKVGYYSYTEDKFYEGEFPVPTEKIKKYLDEKSENPEYQNNKEENHKFNRLEVGFTLGGMVQLWMKGEDSQILLETFWAKEAFPEWISIFPNTDRKMEVQDRLNSNVYSELVKSQITNHTLPINLWKNYNERYPWNYQINIPKNAKLEQVYIKMINAEAETTYNNDPAKTLEKNHALPYNIEFFWELNGKRYNSRIVFGNNMNYYNVIYKASLAKEVDRYPQDFTKEEVYEKFHSFSAKPSLLTINVGEDQTVTVSLKQDDKTIPFKNLITKTFEQ